MCFSGRRGGKQKCNICILFCLSFIGWVSGCWAGMFKKQSQQFADRGN